MKINVVPSREGTGVGTLTDVHMTNYMKLAAANPNNFAVNQR
jgi:hypothetical protein